MSRNRVAVRGARSSWNIDVYDPISELKVASAQSQATWCKAGASAEIVLASKPQSTSGLLQPPKWHVAHSLMSLYTCLASI